MDWDDLRYVLVLARAGTLARTAAALRVDQSTVRRRLDALEESLGGTLVDRQRLGWTLTPLGEQVVVHAERLESEVAEIGRLAGASEDRPEGRVVVTAGEAVMAELLVPYLAGFGARFPGIALDLRVSNQVLDLARGEADIAVRLVRPKERALTARQVGTLAYALYGSPDYIARRGRPLSADDLRGHTFVTYDRTLAASPEGRWLAALVASTAIAVTSSSPFAIIAAARAGFGLATIACAFADRDPRLVRVIGPGELPRRTIWLVGHPTSRRTARVTAVWDHLAAAFEGDSRRLRGETVPP